MATGDIYELTTTQTLQGQQILNVWFFRQLENNTSGLTDAQSLTSAWANLLGPAIKGLQAAELEHVEQLARNLFDPNDFFSRIEPPPGSGTSGDFAWSLFAAISFRSQRGSGVIRRGFKRIAGVDEGNYPQGAPSLAFQTNIDEALLRMNNPIQSAVGGAPQFDHVIVKRIRETDPVTGLPTYRLPTNSAEAQFFVPVWDHRGLSTQNTRKSGRGA